MKMKILMCADGSKTSKSALRFGTIIAKGTDSDVDILHVIEDVRKDKSKEVLAEAKDILTRGGVTEIKTKTRKGKPDLKIIKESERGGYDLVVIGSHGISTLKTFFCGDVAHNVIEHVKIPVLLLREKRKKLKKMLMCTGGSKYAEEAIRFGGDIAVALGAKVTVLHVVPPLAGMYRGLGMSECMKDFLRTNTLEAKYLKRAAKILEGKGVVSEVEIAHGFPAEEILNQAEAGDYDLVVLGSHGTQGIRRFLMGDVAYKVIKHSTVPCLLVKPKELRF